MIGWCERGDSNPHGFTRQILSLVRLPIPPLSHNIFNHLKAVFPSHFTVGDFVVALPPFAPHVKHRGTQGVQPGVIMEFYTTLHVSRLPAQRSVAEGLGEITHPGRADIHLR